MGTLTRADVEHVAHLARLGLTDGELTRLEGELNHILDQFATLARLDTDAIPPTAQVIELENILREDVARPSLSVAEALANAPARDGDHVVVPAILGGESGSELGHDRGHNQGSELGHDRGDNQGSEPGHDRGGHQGSEPGHDRGGHPG
jgi:aspartyl-tRNA(Asn)/glutamyl-tRNA(Gln) amidotransferase subunit C